MFSTSRCVYGGSSPYVKNVLDRSIGYLQPFFRIIDGEMHHVMRHDNRMAITTHFYGDAITKLEEETADRLAKANAVNFGASGCTVHFYQTPEQIRGNMA